MDTNTTDVNTKLIQCGAFDDELHQALDKI